MLHQENSDIGASFIKTRLSVITKVPKTMPVGCLAVDQMVKMKHRFNYTDLQHNTTFLVAKCPDPTPTNGQIEIVQQKTEGQWNDGDEITASCNGGHIPQGPYPLFCFNGTWYGVRPTCIGINNKCKEKFSREG